ncbi:hypothetical protein GCM10023184_39080 [Flaviaesturariibacter amylovorans]|uniref:Lipoprotein n=1 Tax=Flaviaesturariibacter amylovorans TaxID=1084520 RepID=A0ABP8HLI8_9BACT
MASVFLLSGCQLQDESNPPDVSGTYVLGVKTRYGVTSDTIEVVRKAGETTYEVTHKVEFQPNAHDLQHQRNYRVERHIAIFEKHSATLQDIDDGTVFLINYDNRRYLNEQGGYRKIK